MEYWYIYTWMNIENMQSERSHAQKNAKNIYDSTNMKSLEWANYRNMT